VSNENVTYRQSLNLRSELRSASHTILRQTNKFSPVSNELNDAFDYILQGTALFSSDTFILPSLLSFLPFLPEAQEHSYDRGKHINHPQLFLGLRRSFASSLSFGFVLNTSGPTCTLMASNRSSLDPFLAKMCLKLCKNSFEVDQDDVKRYGEFEQYMKKFDKDSLAFFNSLRETDVHAGELHRHV
jgi:hypothetical protein